MEVKEVRIKMQEATSLVTLKLFAKLNYASWKT